MSSHFSKMIQAGERLREFSFRQVSKNDDPRFSIDVPDDNGRRISFSMFRNADREWKIAAQLMPMWVHDAQAALAEAIEESLSNGVSRK